jgi:hypothetical protein
MMRRQWRMGLVVLVVAGSVAGACSSGGSDDSERATGDAAGDVAPQVAGGGAEDGRASLQVAERQRVRTATVELVVDEGGAAGPAADEVAGLAASLGGAVDDDRRRHGEDGRADLVVRVPPDELEDFVAGLSDIAEVTSSAITTDDVTEEYTDLEGRIENLRASVERIRALMAEADDVAQVATLEGELSRREQELEVAEGRMRVLDEQVQLATVTVSITTRTESEIDDGGGGAPSPMDALSGGWSAFVAVLAWMLAVVLALLPFLVTAAVLGLAARALLRRRPTRSADPVAGAGPPVPPVGPHPAPPAGSWSAPGSPTAAASVPDPPDPPPGG